MPPTPCLNCGTPTTQGTCCTPPRDRNLARQYLNTIYRRDDATCHHCGGHVPRDQATLDHLTPRSLAGTDHPSNLALAHRGCNSSRSNLGP